MPDCVYSIAIFPLLRSRLAFLRKRALKLKTLYPESYSQNKTVKLFKAVLKVIEISAQNPILPNYRLGKMLGKEYTHWRRCKDGLPPRYRLFFRFSSEQLVCCYAWLNDEKTLRQENARTDVYVVFRRLLESGAIPTDFAKLMQCSTHWAAVEEFVGSFPLPNTP